MDYGLLLSVAEWTPTLEMVAVSKCGMLFPTSIFFFCLNTSFLPESQTPSSTATIFHICLSHTHILTFQEAWGISSRKLFPVSLSLLQHASPIFILSRMTLLSLGPNYNLNQFLSQGLGYWAKSQIYACEILVSFLSWGKSLHFIFFKKITNFRLHLRPALLKATHA